MCLVDTLFISRPSRARMSLFLVELLCDLSLLLLFTNESARNRVVLSLLYSFLFSLKLIIDLYFVCLVFSVLIDLSLFHSNFQRTGKSLLGVFKAPQYFVSFIGSAVIWGLPFTILLEISFPFLLCLPPPYSFFEVFSLGEHSTAS